MKNSTVFFPSFLFVAFNLYASEVSQEYIDMVRQAPKIGGSGIMSKEQEAMYFGSGTEEFETINKPEAYSENAVLLRQVESRRAKDSLVLDDDPYYENLRASPNEFPMIFTYNGMSFVDKKHLLGYVPSGTLVSKSKNHLEEKTFWTGVTGYFLHDKFGTCKNITTILNNPFTSTGVVYVKYSPDRMTTEINGKPTAKSSTGNAESGYIYYILWTGKNYHKELECSSKNPFDSNMSKDIINYAKKIDNDLPDPVK